MRPPLDRPNDERTPFDAHSGEDLIFGEKPIFLVKAKFSEKKKSKRIPGVPTVIRALSHSSRVHSTDHSTWAALAAVVKNTSPKSGARNERILSGAKCSLRAYIVTDRIFVAD